MRSGSLIRLRRRPTPPGRGTTRPRDVAVIHASATRLGRTDVVVAWGLDLRHWRGIETNRQTTAIE